MSIFNESGYVSETEIGKTEFKYENIDLIAETKQYFVFVFDMSHAQIYDKNSLKEGTIEDFRKFIAEITGKSVYAVK